eukprot:15068738-Alexandrium_andersonii.AAC.1
MVGFLSEADAHRRRALATERQQADVDHEHRRRRAHLDALSSLSLNPDYSISDIEVVSPERHHMASLD